MCACPEGTFGFIEKICKKCLCYLNTDIAACIAD